MIENLKYIYVVNLLIFCSIFNSCKAQDTSFSFLQKELRKAPLNVEYKVSKKADISIEYPVGCGEFLQEYLNKLVDKDFKFEYCQNEGAIINVKYEVGFLTANFISIKKDVQIMFCYASDVVYSEFVNVLLLQEDTYSVNLKTESEFVKSRIQNELQSKNVDEECNYEDNDFSLNLYFKGNHPSVYLDKDKVCNILFPIEMKENIFLWKKIKI